MKSEPNIYDAFRLNGYTNFSWQSSPPKWHDLITRKRDLWSSIAPSLVCTFRREIEDPGVPAYAVFDARLSGGPWMVYAEHLSDGAHRVARAIAEMRWVQHSEYIRKAEVCDVLASINGDTVAAYKLSEPLRKSFPYIEQVATCKTPNGGYVYLIHDHQRHYKIGRSISVDNRIKQLRTQPPFDLDVLASAWVPDYKDEEKFLHEQHKEYRLKGEWFALPDSSVERLCEWMGRIQGDTERMVRAYAEFDPVDWATNRPGHNTWYEKDAVREGYDF